MRVAIFHTELSRDGPGLMLRDILSGKDSQVEAVVKVVRHIAPDVLVLADIDYDLENIALGALADKISGFPHRYASLSNKGRQSGYDLNDDGRFGRPEDAWGYGEFLGQGGMAVLSKLPLGEVTDFSSILWTSLPGAIPPKGTNPDYPLSTRVHWVVPVLLPDGDRLEILTWHATAPVFDGPEDRNGRRNHDEAAFWLDYLKGKKAGAFIVAGFANLDPIDGEGRPDALNSLLSHPLLTDVSPQSEGAALAAEKDGGKNAHQRGLAKLDTADWPEENGPGNLRVDYILPSTTLEVLDAGVFWPTPEQLLGSDVVSASRHRLVWVDVRLP